MRRGHWDGDRSTIGERAQIMMGVCIIIYGSGVVGGESLFGGAVA